MCLAVPGRIVATSGDARESRVARVDFGGIEKEVHLGFLPEAEIGDYVLVHVGLAISKVEPAEAQRVFEYLKQIDALSAELAS